VALEQVHFDIGLDKGRGTVCLRNVSKTIPWLGAIFLSKNGRMIRALRLTVPGQLREIDAISRRLQNVPV